MTDRNTPALAPPPATSRPQVTGTSSTSKVIAAARTTFPSPRPAGAYHDLLDRALPVADQHQQWTPADGPLPSLFVSHGAPFALDDPQWVGELYRWGRSLPRPRGIVVVSAHWEQAPPAISGTSAATPLYYDFAGFDPHYKTLQYATPDAGALARRLVGALPSTTTVHEFTDRGLDHGAFIPLMAMYPAADVPVVQLSMPSLDPQALLKLGARLKQLREEGILVLGSGFTTHSFAVLRDPGLAAHTRAFDEWVSDALSHGDVDALSDFRAKGPGVAIAHPTSEHYVPLLLSIGASDEPTSAVSVIDRMVMGNSTRSVQLT